MTWRCARPVLVTVLVVAMGDGCSRGNREDRARSNAPPREPPTASAAVAAPVTAHPSAVTKDADAQCTSDGCLRSISRVGSYQRSALEGVVEAGATVDNGYTVYTIAFATNGATARATVTIPLFTTPPPRGFHVVANAHGTVGLDDPCAVAGTVAGAGYAGLYGAHGMIGVAPDYPGLGTPGIHPYLVSESEGKAVLDALRATRALAASVGVPLSGRYVVTGLSQGGHATLAAAALHHSYAPDLDIRGFAASGPATVWEEHFRKGIGFDGSHVPLHAMLVYAWADHYHYDGPPLWNDALAPKIDEAMRTDCVFPGSGRDTLEHALGDSATAIFSAPFLAAYRSGDWGPFARFHEYFAANRIGPYRQSAPLKIYQGDADDVVPMFATDAVVAALRAGGDTVDYEVVAGGHHTDVAFGFLAIEQKRTAASLGWIRDRLEP